MTIRYVCPDCRGDIRENEERLTCSVCGKRFAVRNGIPVFFEGEDTPDLQAVRRLIGELRARKFAPEETHARFYLPYRTWNRAAPETEKKSFRSLTRYFDVAGSRILVVSSGAGREVSRLLGMGAREIYFSDISYEAVQYVADTAPEVYSGKCGGLHGFVSDASRLPFADDSFDLILAYASIHHYPDIPAFLAEAHRVAKNLCILAEPATMSVFQPLLDMARWDRYNEYAGDVDSCRVGVSVCRGILKPLYHTVRVEREWNFYPRFLGRWGNNTSFVGWYFSALRLMDLFFGWCSHSVNFYGLEKRIVPSGGIDHV